MRKNEANIWEPRECTVDEQTGDCARCVEVILDPGRGNAWKKIAAAAWRRWVNEHDGLAAIQLLEHGRENGVARPFIAIVGHQRDAIRLESVVPVLNLPQTCVRLEQRQ